MTPLRVRTKKVARNTRRSKRRDKNRDSNERKENLFSAIGKKFHLKEIINWRFIFEEWIK